MQYSSGTRLTSTSHQRRRFFWFIYFFFLFHHAKYPYFSFSPGIVSIPNGPCQACQPNVCPASRGCVWFISPRGLLVRPHSPRVSRAFFFQLPAKIHPERLYTGVISRALNLKIIDRRKVIPPSSFLSSLILLPFPSFHPNLMDFRGYELYSLCIPLYSSFHSCCCWPTPFFHPWFLSSVTPLIFIVHLDSLPVTAHMLVIFSYESLLFQSFIHRSVSSIYSVQLLNSHWLKYRLFIILINFSLETFILYKSKDICLNKKGTKEW